MENHELGRDGVMLEGVGGEDGGRGFGRVQGGRQQKRCLQRQRFFFGRVACAKKQAVQNANVGEDCWTRIFALFREYNLQRLQSMHEYLFDGRRRDEAAAKNEGYERDGEEN